MVKVNFNFLINRLNSSVVEQKTENLCVGSSNLPLDKFMKRFIKILLMIAALLIGGTGRFLFRYGFITIPIYLVCGHAVIKLCKLSPSHYKTNKGKIFFDK